ncbi:MAG: branched-chain amino acid ABC transporter permease [Actinomycetota bacterium]|nr:branched-chain amino acid ABC transporter permease [Actinomycetota bacterium]
MRRRIATRLLFVLVGIAAVIGLGAPAALADGESVGGTLRTLSGDPVANVSITVFDAGGFTGTAVTDEAGVWLVEVPGPGAYTVELDVATLPDGTTPPIRNPIETVADPGTPRTLNFSLGERERNVASFWDNAAQLSVEGLRLGLVIALGAVGLSMIYGTTGLTNFAHGEIITFGALVTWFFNVTLGMHLIIAAVFGVVITGLAGGLLDRGLWKPLRRRGTGLIAMMIITIGLSLALQNLYLIIFGGASRPFDQYAAQAGIRMGPVILTPKDMISMVLAVVVLLLAGLLLLKTRLGKATRAVSDNPALASASGIDVERVILVVWVAGAALAGLGGVLLGLTQQVSFNLGFQLLLLTFAAVTLGGLGTAFGAVVGSLVVGMFIQLSTLFINPELKNVGALAVLILVLLVRPDGILGRRSRVG